MLLIALFFVLCLLGVFRFWWNQHWQDGLGIGVDIFPQQIFAGEKIQLQQQVLNNKPLALSYLHVAVPVEDNFQLVLPDRQTVPIHELEQVYALTGYQQMTRSIPFKVTKRGVYQLREIKVEARNLFLSSSRQKVFTIAKELLVYPKWLAEASITEHWELSLGEALASISLYEDPTLFRNIRALQPEDSFKRINWKKSALTGNFYVNQYEPVAQRQVTIVLQLPEKIGWGKDFLAEGTISMLVTLVRHCLGQGWQISLLTNARGAKDVAVIPAQIRNINTLLEGCARIALDATHPEKELVVVGNMAFQQPIIFCASEITQPEIFQEVAKNYPNALLLRGVQQLSKVHGNSQIKEVILH